MHCTDLETSSIHETKKKFRIAKKDKFVISLISANKNLLH